MLILIFCMVVMPFVIGNIGAFLILILNLSWIFVLLICMGLALATGIIGACIMEKYGIR